MGKPFYEPPLDKLTGTIKNVAMALRTLPNRQLAEEANNLRSLAKRTGTSIPLSAMLALYEFEMARRASPEHRFDDELDVTLSRLERQTTEGDRRRVVEIGEQLHDVGGVAALRQAQKRMTQDHSGRRRELRAGILEARWNRMLYDERR